MKINNTYRVNTFHKKNTENIDKWTEHLKNKSPSEVKDILSGFNEISRKPLLEALPDDLQEQVRILGGWL